MLLGVTANNHDASMALIDNNTVVWAAHSERYSRIKNDLNLNKEMVQDMLQYGEPSKIIWFENPFSKALRKLYSWQRPIYQSPYKQLQSVGLGHLPYDYQQHHRSHAAAGYYTSSFKDATVLVVDAIGEWDTVSCWTADDYRLSDHPFLQIQYPHSIGLFYSALTQWAGLKPNEEEYIFMGMAAHGKPIASEQLKMIFFEDWNPPYFRLVHDLHHGCRWFTSKFSKFDIAASAQAIMEEYLLKTVDWLSKSCSSKNLVFMGGVALNCVANTVLAQSKLFDNIWIMPNPGDSGSAIGAVASYTNKHLDWTSPYLGTDIKQEVDVDAVVQDLIDGNVVAIANGRAEFGPRALGNRSLLCDPRGSNAKKRMNKIKKREQFRPFAPAVLAEHANGYFDMPVDFSAYMQIVAKCKTPNLLPGICHVDNTSRVQTVSKYDQTVLRQILEAWHKATDCPVLMNTSLNVKGEPLVNTWEDAKRFKQLHNIAIY
jgi:carbamoyltransferase